MAKEKYNHYRHTEMKHPCTIPEIIAIYLSLQNPFYQNIKEVDMKFREAKVPEDFSDLRFLNSYD